MGDDDKADQTGKQLNCQLFGGCVTAICVQSADSVPFPPPPLTPPPVVFQPVFRFAHAELVHQEDGRRRLTHQKQHHHRNQSDRHLVLLNTGRLRLQGAQ